MKKFLLITFLLVPFASYAQDFEWVKFYQGNGVQQPVSLSVDKAGNQYATFNFYTEILLDTSTISGSSNSRCLVIKQNTEGKTLWHRVIESPNSNVNCLKSMFNSKGNQLVFVYASYHLIIGSDTVKKTGSGSRVFMLEFNDTGALVQSQILIEGSLAVVSYERNKLAIDKDDNLYLALPYTGSVNVKDSTGTTSLSGTSARNIIFKFSATGRKFEWVKEFPYGTAIFLFNSLKVDIHQNVYIACIWMGHNSFTFNGSSISNTGSSSVRGAVFILNKNGGDKSWFFVESSHKKSSILDIAVHDSNSVFISGNYVGDSCRFDTLWKRNNKYGGYDFIAKYKADGSLVWVKTTDTTTNSNLVYFNNYGSMTNYNDQHFYVSQYSLNNYYYPFIYDGQKYGAGNIGYGLNMKVDARGNILWGFRTLYSFIGMGTDAYDNFYFAGFWNGDTIKFGSFKAYTNNWDAFIGKTFDYAIFRGVVHQGPYCAGDTLLIPYTKTGNYADTNTFFAELSDEFGNFTGRERILGKIRTNKDSTIIGQLPLFQVASSQKYRIRIRSTSPQAQSFYIEDTLRLLIYSRDKADPGPTEAICYGDSIQLSTYGGTKWAWSPKYNMDDSTQRQPLVWPDKDTTYKIIIADSSGCGEPDTAFKKIVIREPLKLNLAFNDTMVCDTSLLSLPMEFSGGDSSNYHWRAYSIDTSTDAWNLADSGKLKLNDTLFHLPKVSISTSQKLAIVLDDQCTNKKDTAYVSIQLLNPSELSTKFEDTLLCKGNSISWKAKPTYSLSKNSVWEWKDITNNKELSTTDSLSLTANLTTKIMLTLTNGCTTDSNVFTLNVNPPLKANILSGKANLNDTTLCLGQSLKLFTIGNGGAGKDYNYSWKVNGNVISTADSMILKPVTASNFILTLVLNDNCTEPVDSISQIVTVIESPKAEFSYGAACNRSNTDFKFTGTKPNSPVSTVFNWNFNNEATSGLENPSHLFSTPGSKSITLTLTSTNGCKDELSEQITVKVQSKANFDSKDVCENDSAVFINNSQDARSYNWYFGDGETSNMPSAKHKYQSGVNPKTYSVKLVAMVKDGCSDSISKSMTVKPAPKADFTWDIACSKTVTKFQFTGTTPQSLITTAYHWNFNNEANSTLENPSHLFASPGTKSAILTLISSNGCTDTTTKTVEILLQSKAGFTANDVCENDSVVFINKSIDATEYRWRFGDGQSSKTQNPKHKYQITNTTTFIVTLVAVVNNGCSDSMVNAVTINQNPNSDFTFTNTNGKIDFKALQTDASNFRWLLGNGDSANISNPDYTYTYKKSGTHTVCLKVTNAAACNSQTCKEIPVTVGISTLAKESGFKLYPNPNTGNFTIEVDNPGNDVYIEVFDAIGKLILKVPGIPNQKIYTIDLFGKSCLFSGLAIVRVRNGNVVWNQKVMVSNLSESIR